MQSFDALLFILCHTFPLFSMKCDVKRVANKTTGTNLLVLIATTILLLVLLPAVVPVLLVEAGVPSKPLYFHDQVIDHKNSYASFGSTSSSNKWTQRYYASSTHFQGPGSPIFLIMGGESAIEPSTGLYYPFVVHHLARDFGAYVLQPEHRFYGESQPLGLDFEFSPSHVNITTSLMTSEQATWDAVRLVRFVQAELKCEIFEKSHEDYCPVITVGGSYPGFLSAMMRVRHSDVVDMAYSASAPMKFYSQNVNSTEYYNHITRVAEKSLVGCSNAVRSNLVDSFGSLVRDVKTMDDFQEMLSMLGICKDSLPAYIQQTDDGDIEEIRNTFYQELNMIVAYTFANYNMAYYPPGNTTSLYQACSLFLNQDLEPYERLSRFLLGVENSSTSTAGGAREQQCFDMTSQLPSGKNATISSGDWSGVGSQRNGQMWDFQTCHLLVERIGFGSKSMFPERSWTMEWLEQHCQLRFGVIPDPYKLVHEWMFDDLEHLGATHILFTNGLNDGWSVGGITQNISDTLLVLNFDNGAHHSDLSAVGPSDRDTLDIQHG